MLQQTQVSTVIPYFLRFVERCPDLDSLASAELDEVLSLWSGLGYYARARNLHKTAKICAREHAGQLPDSHEQLVALPGIGLSTANAILAQAWNRRAVILDGNVKRVLARHRGIEGWPGKSAVMKKLWQAAETLTPADHAADYSQAIMDLGATLCTRSKAACTSCPVAADCRALSENRVGQLPAPRPPRARPERQVQLLIRRKPSGELLLERRPPSGIWGGLWSLPDAGGQAGLEHELEAPPDISHQFTHFSLHIRFRQVVCEREYLIEDGDQAWFSLQQALTLGLPQPIRRVIETLQHTPSLNEADFR